MTHDSYILLTAGMHRETELEEGYYPDKEERIRAAAVGYLYQKNPLPVVVCGGKMNGTEFSLAHVLGQYLENFWKVHPDHIILEEQSLDTIENAQYGAKKLKEYGLSNPVLITNEFHLRRADMCFSRAGVKTTPIGAEHVVRELSDVVNNYLDDYLSSDTMKKREKNERLYRGIMHVPGGTRFMRWYVHKKRG